MIKSASSMWHLNYRADIDGLRAFAVLSVILFHAFPTILPGGFVGVDVFFVISGFLITSIIIRGLVADDFRFAIFYARRVKRIFPALFLVLVSVYTLGWFFLLPVEFKELGKNIAGGAAFTSNFVLLGEAGYFDSDSNLKPLLHLWSLGIEEQFYILWPLMMFGAFRAQLKLRWLLVILAIASFSVCVAVVRENAIHAFYLPYTRAWELLGGAFLATFLGSQVGVVLRSILSGIGMITLVAAMWIINSGTRFPGWAALLPVLGAVFIIGAGTEGWVNRKILAHPVMVFIGTISYPLYLWHWPLLVFARIALSGTPSVKVRSATLLLSVLLAWITYIVVERPIRSGGGSGLKVGMLCFLIGGVGYVGWNAFERDGLEFRNVARESKDISINFEWPYWASQECSKRFGTDPNIDPCEISSAVPRIMLLGDSHANHFYPGLVKTNPSSGVINVGTCIPLKDVEIGALKNPDANQCAGKNIFARDMKILDQMPSVRTVILSGWLKVNLDAGLEHPDFRSAIGQLTFTSTHSEDQGVSREEIIFRGLSRTIDYLESKRLRVIFVLDTPFIEADVKEFCSIGNRFRAPGDCAIPRTLVDKFREKEMVLVTKLKTKHPNLVIFDPDDVLCDENKCYLLRDRVLLYRDRSHLSIAGSNLVARAMTPILFSN